MADDGTPHQMPEHHREINEGELDAKLRARLADVNATGTQGEADFYNDMADFRLGGAHTES